MKSFNTISEMKKTLGEASAKSSSGGGKRFLFLRDGDTYKIRFRQELTEDGSGFDEDRGAASVVQVITSPINWKHKGMSTADLETSNYRCWASEQIPHDKRWTPKPHLLVNIVAEIEPGKWEPRVIETTFNPRHIGATVIEYAEAYGTLTDRYYKYSRTGSGAQDTQYALIPLESAEETAEHKAIPLFDLDSIYKVIPYEDQESFYPPGEVSKTSGAW